MSNHCKLDSKVGSQFEPTAQFARFELQLSSGSGPELFDEMDWEGLGSITWQYIISGSTIVGGSQLAQERASNAGMSVGLYPGQLVIAPLSAYLSSEKVDAQIAEYFLDNRAGLPDPRTFADPSYYCDSLIEVVASIG